MTPDLRRLQRALRGSATPFHEVIASPPFVIYYDPSDPLKFFTYAIPDDGAEPTESEIDALREQFLARERLPRLEWIDEVSPAVAPALARSGMVEELRTPLMACSAHELRDAVANVGALTIESAAERNLRDLDNVRRRAFGRELLREDEAPRDPRAVGGGGAVAQAGSEAVSGAVWTPIVDGVSEIVGVGTAPEWRGRGLAGAVTAAAARDAFAAGAEMCILAPDNEQAMRIYERAGFYKVATQLDYADVPPR